MNRKCVQRQAGRCSVPPYAVQIVAGNDFVIHTRPGREWAFLGGLCSPSVEEFREMIVRLRRTLRWSRPMLAAFLGVSAHAVNRWETGQRNPSAAARRLVWLASVLVHEPQRAARACDWLLWRGVDLNGSECQEEAEPVGLTPC